MKMNTRKGREGGVNICTRETRKIQMETKKERKV
jgi:hypothetical protein